jgi:hypothetical protein
MSSNLNNGSKIFLHKSESKRDEYNPCPSLSLNQKFSKKRTGSITTLWSITEDDIKYLVGYDGESSWYWAQVNFRPQRLLFSSNSLSIPYPSVNEIVEGISVSISQHEKLNHFADESRDILSLLFTHLLSVGVHDDVD